MRIDVYHHVHCGESAILAKLAEIEALLRDQFTKENIALSQITDAVNATAVAVANEDTVIDSVETLVTNLSQTVETIRDQLASGTVDVPGAVAKLTELTTTMNAKASALASAVTAGTGVLAEKVITGITQANPAVVSSVAHGLIAGATGSINGVVGMVDVNGRVFTVANPTADAFALGNADGTSVDSTAFGAYVSGGRFAPTATPVVAAAAKITP